MKPIHELTSFLRPLYSNTLNLREGLGELKETIKDRAKSFVKGGPEDIGPKRRLLSAIFGLGIGYFFSQGYQKTYFPPDNPAISLLKVILVSEVTYVTLECLGAAITGRYLPIAEYVREQLKK